MDIKQILEELKVNNIEFVEELWSQPNSNEYHVICKFPNGRCYNYYNALEKGAPLSGPFKSIEEATEDLLANNPSSTKCWENSEVESSSGNLELTYMTDFHLKHPVIDLESANQYLSDDMTTYIKDDERISKSCRDKINSISWKLSENRIDGHITVEANDYLTKKESKSISEWISGQCSDGIGWSSKREDTAKATTRFCILSYK